MRLDRRPGGHAVAPLTISMDLPNTAHNAIPAPGGRVHRVQPGEDLQAISNRYFHDGGGVGLIYAANRNLIGVDPRQIYAGQVLSIPYPSSVRQP